MSTPQRLFPAFVILIALCMSAQASEKVDFNYEIRPIISTKCFHCHGPDEKSREAGLRLDLREEALKEIDGLRAIVPGKPEASELMIRITTKDRDEVMPPPKENHPLTPQEVNLFRRWIAEGAEYQEHWSFTKLARPSVPEVAGVKNPIDAFIRAKLAGTGLSPSPEADRYSLIRRLSLDLTGLPPTPEETDVFVNDPSSDAYEKVVDRLLASPAYGERWAKMWLDLARYADSTGYGSDKFRLTIWPYRDWVINAFNRNLPYDQFTIEQLAGDLLPNATPEQISATAFHRNTLTNVEGGTNDEEWRVAAVKDRVATTGQVWMGLTVGCAQCHTHKFDPITHQDYYSFFGVFNQTEDSDREDEEPKMPLPTPEEKARLRTIEGETKGLAEKLRGTTPELLAELREWEPKVREAVPWTTLTPTEATAASRADVAVLPDQSVLVSATQPESDFYTVKVPGRWRGITGFRLEALTDPQEPAKGPGRFPSGNFALSDFRVSVVSADQDVVKARYVRVERADTGFIHLAEVQAFAQNENVARQGKASQSTTYQGAEAVRAIDGNIDGTYNKKSVQHTNDADQTPWWEVDLGSEQPLEKVVLWNRTDGGAAHRISGARLVLLDAERKPVFEQKLDKFDKDHAVAMNGAKSVPLQNASADFEQQGHEAARAIDATSETSWAVGGATGQAHALVVETTQPLDVPEDTLLVFTLHQKLREHTLGRFRISMTTKAAPVRELPTAIEDTLATAEEARSAKQQEQLVTYFRPISRQFADVQKQLDRKRAEQLAIKPVALPIMRERAKDKRRETHILTKGNYLSPGEKVEPGLLATFASYVPADAPMDRLAAARWLVNPENPLTARVTVNRFWSRLFGTGIVETEEDFGSQGALPSHPELLDWLAITFMSPKTNEGDQRSTMHDQLSLGWDVKALLRLMVTSATYRQSSVITPQMIEKDARNRLFARAPRLRLDAEAVRDQALAVSGLLSKKMGGPSVYPPQPDGLWKVAFNGGQNAYPTSKGEDRYRRGIYTFWRRTMPPPSMTTFDAPSRESCTLRRQPTNTPLQAFVTMNDPAFVECSQALARRIVREGGVGTEARLRFGLRLCTGRPPTDQQVSALGRLYTDELTEYRADPAAAIKLATQPLGPIPPGDEGAAEFAAWTVVANVLLNLDTVLTKN
jgi:hypothetical protein